MSRTTVVGCRHRWFSFFCGLLALMATVAILPVGAMASAGVWTPAASLSAPRYQQTATLLPNGKILVVGGYSPTWPYAIANAELYDPATNSWSAAGTMAEERRFHTATLLPNGKVLVVGGNDNLQTLASAELYDPATNSWSAAAPMSSIRMQHTATLLADGKLLVVGGTGTDDLSSAELYNPSANAWSPAGSLTTARRNHTATLLPSGRVLVVGGGTNSTSFYSAELYNPVDNSWSSAGAMSSARSVHTASLLANGKVLVVGGYDRSGDSYLTSTEIYDPDTNSWVAGGSLAAGLGFHTATLLPNGRLLVTGGHNYNNAWVSSAEQYDPASNSWTTAGSLTTGRYQHTATLLPDGRVLAVGGTTASGEVAAAEIYGYAVATWNPAAPLLAARTNHESTLLPNGKVLVVGGAVWGGELPSMELYDPATSSWSAAINMTTPRSGHTVTLLTSGKVLIVGGRNGSLHLASAQLYDPVTNTLSDAGTMAVPRAGHTATLLPNNKVLIAGGSNDDDQPPVATELYDPVSNTWSSAGSLATGRYSHTANVLPDGRVMVIGGFWDYVPTSGYASLASLEIYDPVANKWSLGASLANSRADHATLLLPDGSLLVAGGTHYQGGHFSTLGTVEVYNPASNAWTPGPSMITARDRYTTTLLPDGRFLTVGGYDAAANYSPIAEYYDPATNSWKSAGSLINGRVGHSATLLPNGTVLFAGGIGLTGMGNDIYSSAEIFNGGLGFSDNRRPVISSLVYNLGKYTITGSKLRGDSEGTGGATNGSATDYPLVHLQRVQGGQQAFIPSDPASSWSATNVTFNRSSLLSLLNGTYRVTTFTNGVPGNASFLTLSLSPYTSVAPGVITEWNVYVGSSETKTLTLHNTGTRPLQMRSVAFSGTDAAMFSTGAGGTCGSTLAIGDSCTINIGFTPTSSGSKTATVEVVSDNRTRLLVNITAAGILPSYALTLTMDGTGSGTVNGTTSTTPPTLSFATSTSQSLQMGTVVTLNAASAAGSVFSGWSGDCTGSGSCTVTMTTAKNVTASFTADWIPPVTTVTPAGGTYNAPQLVALASNEPATIYYSTDGSEPTTSSMVYTGPLTIAGSSTLKFFAVDAAQNQESVQTQSYDINGENGAWSTGAALPYGVSRGFSVVKDSKIYILGGSSPAAGPMIDVSSYDPVANSWTLLPPLTQPIFGGASATIGSTIYLLGGLDDQWGYRDSVIAYDTITGASSTVGTLVQARARMNAAVLNNKIYVVGGSNADTTIEEYDPATNTSRIAATLPEPTVLAGVAAYQGKLLIAAAGTGNTKTWLFDPASGMFGTLASLPATAEGRTLIVNDDRFYLVDGFGYTNNINYVYEFNITANTWIIATTVPTLRDVPMVEAVNGVLYVLGGNDNQGSDRNEAWRFASGWSVHSVNPNRSDMVDWPLTQHGPVPVGSVIKIGSVFYYVSESETGSWTGPDYVRAALSECDQSTGMPTSPAYMAGSPGQEISYDLNPPTVNASPAGGGYTGPQWVGLTADKPCSIYYTTDGSDPTTASPLYAEPVHIAPPATLKFFARSLAGVSGPVKTEVYTSQDWLVHDVRPEDPSWIDWSANQHDLVPAGSYLWVNTIRYYVNQAETSPWSGPGFNAVKLQQCDQTSGQPLVNYFTCPGACNWVYPCGDDTMCGPEWVCQTIPCPQPVFADLSGTAGMTIATEALPTATASPAGGSYQNPITVTLTTGANSAIYYTLDGTEPTMGSIQYTTPIAIYDTTTLKFFARDAWGSGMVQTETYVITPAPDNSIITTVAGNGTTGYSGDGMVATGTSLNYPEDVAVDNAGNLYIADSVNNRIRRVDKFSGTISTIAGNGVAEYSGDGGPAYMAGLSRPFAVALDSSGNIYISDNLNFRVRKIDQLTGTITTVAGNGVNGYSGDGGPATDASLGDIRGIAVDNEGNIYIADCGSNGIRKVDQATGIITTIASGYHPEGVTLDSTGNLYYAETWGNVIVRLDKVTGTTSIVAGTGANGYGGDGGPATQASLSYPHRVVVDGSGNIYIADTENNRIRKVDSATGIITTVAGTGIGGFSGDGGPASLAMVTRPKGISVDVNGSIYFTDNNRIRTIAGNSIPADTTPPITSVTPPGGSYAGPVIVTFTTNEPATIYYTTDNTIPTTASPVYSGPFTISTPTNLFFFARDAAGNSEEMKFEFYEIRMDQTITFPLLPAKTYGDATFGLSAFASSGWPISYESDNPAVATVNGTMVTIIGAGTAHITARQEGNSSYNPAPAVTRTLQVDKALATITLGNLSATYDGTPKTVTVTTTPALPVITTYGGLATPPSTAGSYAVISTISSANYQGSATGTLVINKAPVALTIAAPDPVTATFGEQVTLTATISPAGAPGQVQFSNGQGWMQMADVIAGSARLITAGIPSGINIISARYLENDNYLAATSTAITLPMNKASQVITFPALATKTILDAPFVPGASVSSGLDITYTSSNPAVATVSGNTITIVGLGTTTIIAGQWGDANHNGASTVSQPLTVTKAPANVIFGALNFTYDGTSKGVLVTTTPPALAATITYAGSSEPPTAAGSYPVVATIVDAVYEGSVSGILTIDKAAQTIAFDDLPVKAYGDGPFVVNATATSSLPVTYTSSNPAVAMVSGTTITILAAGTTTITASQGGNENFQQAPELAKTLTVAKALAPLSLGSLAATYDGTPKAASATTSPAGLTVAFTYNGATSAPTLAGTYTVVGTIVNDNYQGSATGTLTLARAATTIDITPATVNPSIYGQPVTISATVSPAGATGKVLFSNGSGWSQEVDLTGAGTAVLTTTSIPAGMGTITAQYQGDDNFLPGALSAGVIQIINKADQSITFAPLGNRMMGSADFAPTAAATSNLPVTFISSNTAVARVINNVITIVGPGTTTIIATQWGDNNYNAATAIAQTLTVVAADMGIKLTSNGTDSYFTTLSAAYGSLSAGTSAAFQLPMTTLTESLLFDKDLEVTLLGGYDPLSGTYAGVTAIQGSITIQGGSLIIAEPVSIL